MGCFLSCFGSKKDRKRRRQQRYKVIPRDQQRHVSQSLLQATVPFEQGISEKPPSPYVELSVKLEEQLSLSNRKRVTFDSNIKTYEHIPVDDSTEPLLEKGNEEIFPPVLQTQSHSQSQSQSLSRSNSEGNSVASSVGSYLPSHRHQNCQDSDDEVEDLEYEDSDFDDEDDDTEDQEDYADDYDEAHDVGIVCQNVWSEAIPVASEESRFEASLEAVGMKQFARDRSEYIHPVLNPVENLSQWKAVKKKGNPPLNQQIAVDASLSNWLTSSETTPSKKVSTMGLETIASEKSSSHESTATSLRSLEDRPILGALTVEELRQFSANSSPRKSPSRSPEDMPIIGSVRSYWSHSSSTKDSGSLSSYKGIPNTTSKYREDKKVNWHNTPFETRLERALNKDAAEA